MSADPSPATREVHTGSAGETEAAAARLARSLRPGDVLLLEGPLGAGKTTFVRGLAQGLGVEGRVASPTYQLVRVYQGRIPLVHADLFRLENPAELSGLDLDEPAGRGVLAVEWGDRITWPGAGRVRLEERGPTARTLRLLGAPERWSF
ncbi:MAG: tRNA (adenosine(37)-N6)-threonylcarbamoyltransferase complex ATPase subunit type 1 TsaE [Candidatus Dormibacteraceae bacterium]